jgi:hypothetical protein
MLLHNMGYLLQSLSNRTGSARGVGRELFLATTHAGRCLPFPNHNANMFLVVPHGTAKKFAATGTSVDEQPENTMMVDEPRDLTALLGDLDAGRPDAVEKLSVAVYDQWARGDVAGAARQHAALFPVVQFLFAEVNPVPVKAMMADMGLCRNELRLPLAPGRLPDEALVRDLA